MLPATTPPSQATWRASVDLSGEPNERQPSASLLPASPTTARSTGASTTSCKRHPPRCPRDCWLESLRGVCVPVNKSVNASVHLRDCTNTSPSSRHDPSRPARRSDTLYKDQPKPVSTLPPSHLCLPSSSVLYLQPSPSQRHGHILNSHCRGVSLTTRCAKCYPLSRVVPPHTSAQVVDFWSRFTQTVGDCRDIDPGQQKTTERSRCHRQAVDLPPAQNLARSYGIGRIAKEQHAT